MCTRARPLYKWLHKVCRLWIMSLIVNWRWIPPRNPPESRNSGSFLRIPPGIPGFPGFPQESGGNQWGNEKYWWTGMGLISTPLLFVWKWRGGQTGRMGCGGHLPDALHLSASTPYLAVIRSSLVVRNPWRRWQYGASHRIFRGAVAGWVCYRCSCGVVCWTRMGMEVG